MKDILLLGAGKIGEMIVTLLAPAGGYRVTVADTSLENLKRLPDHKSLSKTALNITNAKKLVAAMKGKFAVISAVPFFLNANVARAARDAGVHFLDLTEDVESTLVDCYNANPSSFRAALDALAALAAGRRRVAVAGTMLELGRESAELHRRVAGWMIDGGVELVAAVGAFAEAFEGLGGAGGTEVIRARELEEAYDGLRGRLEGSEAVLIKASRGMRFERAVEMLERDFGRGGQGVSSETGERGA